ncbi:MAG: hypothetical protein K9N55_19000, partial [Phycisphaerae bacterium]|nr:hypothetical protein [Phycisphaerae bacterium]
MKKALNCIITLWLTSALGPVLAASAWLDPQQTSVTTSVCTEDNQFSWYSGPGNPQEWGLNFGAATRTRLKGHQDITALKFDLSAFKGRTVVDAELHLARADAIPIFAMVVSTINSDWHEGTQRGAEAKAGEPCWRWRSRPADETHPGPNDEWTFSHSDFSTAAFGNYGSLVAYGYKAQGTFGTYTVRGQSWVRMKLTPGIVHALMCDQFGLAVTDSRGYNHQNPQVYTNDQYRALAPRLWIQFDEVLDRQPPDSVTSLVGAPGPGEGELVLSFQAPNDPESDRAFGYHIWISDTDDLSAARLLDRWRIPRPGAPGTDQRVLIEGLNPGAQ